MGIRVLFVFLLIGLSWGRPGLAGLDPAPTVVSAPVAVFPLRNATGEAGLDWISVGLQDSLTVDLWYVAALHTKALPQMTELLRAVCPDPTLACVAGQNLAAWQGQAKAQGYGGFLWGEYRRDGDAWVLRLGWYGRDGDAPLAEQTVRGSSPPELLAAATEGLRALLAARGIAVTEAERARMKAPKTRVATAWEQNALGYWEQIRYYLAADDAQRTARVAIWEQHLRAAVQADPDYAEAWNNLGWQRYGMNVYEGEGAALGATTAFEQALRHKPELIDALVGRGATRQALDKVAEALPAYEKAVALNPSLAPHRQALLDAYAAAHQPQAGLAQLAALDDHLQRHGREDERLALHAWRITYCTELKQWPQVLAAYRAWDAALARSTDDASRNQRLELASQLHDLGAQRQADGAVEDAEAAYRQALAIREAVRGPEHLDVARSLRALAENLQQQQRASEAEPLLQRVDALWKAQRAALAAKQQQMGWEQLQGPARAWWQAFFDQNAEQPDTVLILLEELAKRQAALEEFFQAYGQSGAKSIPEVLQALDQYRAEAPALEEANRLAETGNTLYEQGRYQEAEEPFRRALAIREKALGPDHLVVATSLNGLAELYRTTGRYAEAESFLQRALVIDEKARGPDHPNVATSLNNLANLYRTTGRTAEAESFYRRALAITERALGPGHPDVAITLNNLASLYRTTGRYAEAEPLLQRALAIKEKALGPGYPDVATSLNDLASLYDTTGRYAEAEPLYRRALAIREKALGPGHPHVATSLNDLALLYDSVGRYAEADSLYQRALAIEEKALGPDHSDVATILNNLAGLYYTIGRTTEAEPLLQRALAIKEKALGPDHPAVAEGLVNLASLYDTTGRTVEAEPLFQRALAIYEKALGPNHTALAESLINLAWLYRTTGRYAEAEPLYGRALRIAQTAGDPDLLWHVQYGYAQLLHATQRPDATIFFGKQAVNTLQGLRGNVARMDKDTQRAFKAKVQDPYKNLAAWLADAGRLPEAQRVLDLLKEEEYFEYVRRDASAAGTGQPLTFTAAETPPADQYRTASVSLTRLAAERKTLLALATRSPEQEAQLTRINQQWDSAEQAFQQTLQNICTTLATVRPDKVEHIKEAEGLMTDLEELGGGTVAIYTLVGEKRLYLLLITPTVRKAYSVAVSEAEVNRAVLAFRQALANPRLDPRPAAQPFYRWLIQPLEKDLQDSGAKTLLWSLDGSLRYLPVAALHDGQQYLAERYAQLVFTPASQARLKDPPKTTWQALGLGVTQARSGFAALPAVRAELTALIRDPDPGPGLLPGRLLFDDAFTRDALLRELQQRRPLVHISSHFRFTPGNDNQSYLLLGQGEPLRLNEVEKQPTLFAGVDLLTLSACETAMGDAPNATGAEVEGFAVLAQRKGAKAVLATLWSVADASTGQFMQRFYALRQNEHLTKAEALRRAQVEFLRGNAASPAPPADAAGLTPKGFTPDPPSAAAPAAAPPFTPPPGAPYAHPYYWAPFILLGNGR